MLQFMIYLSDGTYRHVVLLRNVLMKQLPDSELMAYLN